MTRGRFTVYQLRCWDLKETREYFRSRGVAIQYSVVAIVTCLHSLTAMMWGGILPLSLSATGDLSFHSLQHSTLPSQQARLVLRLFDRNRQAPTVCILGSLSAVLPGDDDVRLGDLHARPHGSAPPSKNTSFDLKNTSLKPLIGQILFLN